MYARWGAHKPVWERESTPSLVHGPTLHADAEADVAVVGAGITGLSCALNLLDEGLSVVVLTEGRVGGGATGKSSAHLSSIPDLSLHKLIETFGLSAASEVIGSLEESINKIETLSKKSMCYFERVSAYKYRESKDDPSELNKERGAAKSLGLKFSSVQATPLPFPVEEALVFENQGVIHPSLYLQCLAREFLKRGGKIFENSKVTEIQDGVVKTDSGSVTAKNIVIATHSPIGVYLSIHTRIAPYFTYVLGARLAHPAPKGLFWDSSNPYFYLRSLNEEDQKMIIVGGRDHKTGQESHTYDRYAELENFLRERFDVTDISFYWGHEVFESVDGLPYIGKIPLKKKSLDGHGIFGSGNDLRHSRGKDHK